jgi:hypothetical protein
MTMAEATALAPGERVEIRIEAENPFGDPSWLTGVVRIADASGVVVELVDEANGFRGTTTVLPDGFRHLHRELQ